MRATEERTEGGSAAGVAATNATMDFTGDPQTVPVGFLALACGLIVANIYYSQPIAGLIAPSLGLSPAHAGIIVAFTQVGYGLGLLFLVPLSDVMENRRLVTLALAATIVSLLGVALSASVLPFMIATLAVGFFAVATQILLPFAAHLAPAARRGKVVGNLMGGLLAGIMLARPLASLLAAWHSWRTVFLVSAVVLLELLVVLRWVLPTRLPQARLSYGQILRSLPGLVRNNPLLRRRGIYQGMMFAAFNVFWTASPLMLARQFGFDQRHIAYFTLAGAAGALSAPLAGRLADRGWTRGATAASLAAALLSFVVAGAAGALDSWRLLLVAALILDAAVQICQVLSLRSLYMLSPEKRGRLNGLFMSFVFLCGAIGSSLGAAAYEFRAWGVVCVMGIFLVTAGIVRYGLDLLDDWQVHSP